MFLPEDEKNLISQFNQTRSAATFAGLVPDIFHQVATKKPNNTAVVFHREDQTTEIITYQELETASNKLANYLNSGLTDSPSKTVGICLKRNSNWIATALATFKSGRIAAPMESKACDALTYKINNLMPPIVLVDNSTKNLFADYPSIRTINIEDISVRSAIEKSSAKYNAPSISPDDPAYIMFTSGTSGKPKAVQLSHSGFANLFNGLVQHFSSYAKKLPQIVKTIYRYNLTWDANFFDLLASLAFQSLGKHGELHMIYEEGCLSSDVVNNLIKKENMTFGVFTPDILRELDPSLPLKYVITMGAAPHENTLLQWSQDTNRIIENGLGHTETGICLSLYKYIPGEDVALIGPPIANMQMLLLKEVAPDTYAHCKIGETGEIFVLGSGVANGYIGNEELTKKKFPRLKYDPATQTYNLNAEGVKAFKSGDQAVFQMTNKKTLAVKFLGRNDRQLKRDGDTVELDGVEEMLRKIPEIKDVAVLPSKENKSIIAYVVPAETANPDELRDHIRKAFEVIKLPVVAYPNVIIPITELPLTANGKVDTHALHIPTSNAATSNTAKTLQNTLLELWKNILTEDDKEIANEFTREVDVNSTTFKELGGHSKKMAKLAKAIKSSLEIPLTPVKILARILHPDMTIASLEKRLQPFLQNKPQNIIQLPYNAFFNFKRHRIILQQMDSEPELEMPEKKSGRENNM